MKRKVFAIFLIAIFSTGYLYAQVNPNDPNYQIDKAAGNLPLTPDPVPYNGPIPTMGVLGNHAPNSGLLIPLDGTFTLAMAPNDDGSAGPFSLPFTFCFYGNNETGFYINNNGNVSFGGPYWQYTPSGFPLSGFPMLAPFWADVDTRSCGNVWYKIETSPYRVTVIWEEVGYFYNHCDKVDYMELIFTDGNDPLIGIGNNVAFSYNDLQWTTGDITGNGGFGGSPASVGINSGDGVNFALVGRFDHPGSDYDGPGGNPDGVDYLDNQAFVFNTCNAQTNIPPVPTGFPSMPIVVNVGETYNLTVQFLAPEVGQTVTTVVADGGLSGFTYTSIPGNPSVVTMQLIGSLSNLGAHTVQLTATDDGVPVGITTVNVDFIVQQGGSQVPISNWAVIIAVILIGTIVWVRKFNG